MSIASNLEFEKFMNGLNTNPIPLEFTQALSTSEFLHVLLDYIKKVADNSTELNDSIYAEFNLKFNELGKELESKVSDAKILDGYMSKIYEFCTTYISDLIADSLKYITFELTDDGHFCALIPKNLVDIVGFDTDINSTSDNYGKLIIKY